MTAFFEMWYYIYEAINLKTCVEKRISEGGTGLKSVEKQIEDIKAYLKQ